MIRIFMLEDNALVKAALNGMMLNYEDLEIAGEASEFSSALEKASQERWDVLWLSMGFADKEGWVKLKRLFNLQPGLRTLIVGDSSHPPKIINALKMGAAGYITKSNNIDVYPNAIRKIANGESYISEDLVSSLVEAMNDLGNQDKSPHELLTAREQEVFMLITRGMRVTDVANELNISVKTVSTHRKNILDKLNIKTTADMVRYAMEFGLVA